LIIGVEKERYAYEQRRIWPGKTGSVIDGQLLISLYSIKLHFLLRLEIDWWILRCCQSIISLKFRRYTAYRQYLLIKSATLVFWTEC